VICCTHAYAIAYHCDIDRHVYSRYFTVSTPDLSWDQNFTAVLGPTLCYTSGGFRGGPSRLRPPPWRPTDAVTVLLISDNGTVLWRRLSMIATSGFLAAIECTKFVFGRGSRTPLRELTALFQIPWLKGDPTSKGRGRPRNANFSIRPCIL